MRPGEDADNCGSCGASCLEGNVEEGACVEGQCVIVACAPGWADCNNSAGDGCELAESTCRPDCGWIGGTDMAGQDLVLTDGGTLGGRYLRVGRFFVAADSTVRVEPYSADDGEATGRLEVCARVVEIEGTVDATGSGYGGGGGGAGGTHWCNVHACSPSGGVGLRGGAGQGNGGGADGVSPQGATQGGRGGTGGGQFGGSAGAGGAWGGCGQASTAGRAGGPGGYAAPGVNGDETTGEWVRMGSGGGGGGGGASNECFGPAGYAGAGGAGNRGGGAVVLVASQGVRVSGAILARGLSRSAGDGQPGVNTGCPSTMGNTRAGRGGHAGEAGQSAPSGAGGLMCAATGSPPSDGAHGGEGAGGGVLVKSPSVVLTGVVDVEGGLGPTNGGTIKVFSQEAPHTANLRGGRVYTTSY